jgi:putative tryptophan/tyrosine transport system substrate-binding protein
MSLRRRQFISLLGGAAAAWPLTARAQQPGMPAIGLLSSASASVFADRLPALRQGLGETGYVEGRNLAIEYRWADGRDDRLPALVADLLRRNVTVIVTGGGSSPALAAKAATTTIPIVFQVGGDPVDLGLVPSLNLPGGNLTGVTLMATELGPKTVALLHELVPGATVVACLVNPTSSITGAILTDLQAAANTLGLQLHALYASADRDLDRVFANLDRLRPGGLVIAADPFFTSRSEQIAALTLRHAVPAIYPVREFVTAGGLMSYGGSIAEAYRQVGTYVGRILKGERPGDLPVQYPTKIELILNLRSAKVLGLDVPLFLQQRADEVIE